MFSHFTSLTLLRGVWSLSLSTLSEAGILEDIAQDGEEEEGKDEEEEEEGVQVVL